MADQGRDLSPHRGRQLTLELALDADLILVMDSRQKEDCARLVPSARGRIYLLGHWQPEPDREIQDPFRQGTEAIQRAFQHISRAVEDWAPHLINQQR